MHALIIHTTHANNCDCSLLFVYLYIDEITPFDFFRQESSDTDALVRAEAMTRIHVIAGLMTPATVKSDLIPYLQSKLIQKHLFLYLFIVETI